MISLLVAVATASFLGSLHCAGMCGGLVAFYAAGRGRRWPAHAAYSGGRLLVYVTLGVIAGALGGALDLVGSLAGVQRVAAIVAGVAMVAWGVVGLLRLRGLALGANAAPGWLGRLLGRGMALARRRGALGRGLLLGLLSGLLPCGWLYAFVLTAAGTGRPLAGAVVMAAFWTGTVPVLLGLGAGVGELAPRLGRKLPALTALVVVALGLFAIVRRAPLIGALDLGPSPAVAGATVPDADQAPPCCRGE